MRNTVFITTSLIAWAMFMFTAMSVLANNGSGCMYYGTGLIVSGVALKLEMDAWL